MHRRLLYEVALCSGLRANELRSLSVDDLDIERCGLRLHAEWTKNRKAGFQPLPGKLVQELQASAESRMAAKLYDRFYPKRNGRERIPASPLLYVPAHPSRDFDKDLKAARVEKRAFGGKVDFHACRVAYVTLMDGAGAGVKETQSLARHATPGMTFDLYARARDERLAELAEAVGAVVMPEPSITRAQRRIERKAAGAESLYVGETYDDGELVGVGGFEPPASASRTRRSKPD